jgi:DNA-directed RNA polymerase specialized sigma24 family protein
LLDAGASGPELGWRQRTVLRLPLGDGGQPVPDHEGAPVRFERSCGCIGARWSQTECVPSTQRVNDERVEPLRLLVALRGEFLAFLRRRPVPGVEPEDLLQQGFLRATSRIEQLREPSLAVPWFYRVLRRVLADQVEAGRESAQWEPNAELAGSGTQRLCSCAMWMLQSLPASYSEILRRVDVEGDSLAEVAVSLGTTVNNATVRLHRARKALRERLRDACSTTSLRACLDCEC